MIYMNSETFDVSLSEGREVMNPEVRINEGRNGFLWNPHLLENLPLILYFRNFFLFFFFLFFLVFFLLLSFLFLFLLLSLLLLLRLFFLLLFFFFLFFLWLRRENWGITEGLQFEL